MITEEIEAKAKALGEKYETEHELGKFVAAARIHLCMGKGETVREVHPFFPPDPEMPRRDHLIYAAAFAKLEQDQWSGAGGSPQDELVAITKEALSGITAIDENAAG